MQYRTCPKCANETDTPADACPACGIVYAKWLRRQLAAAAPPGPGAGKRARNGFKGSDPMTLGSDPLNAVNLLAPLGELALHTPDRVNPFEFWGRVLVLAGLAAWGAWFIVTPIEALGWDPGFMHRVNLPFHEFGHLLFRPFGHLMMYLGGSLFQVLVPLLLGGTFLLKYANPFAAAVCLWWAGQSLQDVAPYIADASAMQLTLLGGRTGWEAPGMHDWQQILGDFNRLEWDRPLAAWVNGAGIAWMLLALAWAAWLLARQWRNVESI